MTSVSDYKCSNLVVSEQNGKLSTIPVSPESITPSLKYDVEYLEWHVPRKKGDVILAIVSLRHKHVSSIPNHMSRSTCPFVPFISYLGVLGINQ
jgi:hypothetical protein